MTLDSAPSNCQPLRLRGGEYDPATIGKPLHETAKGRVPFRFAFLSLSYSVIFHTKCTLNSRAIRMPFEAGWIELRMRSQVADRYSNPTVNTLSQ